MKYRHIKTIILDMYKLFIKNIYQRIIMINHACKKKTRFTNDSKKGFITTIVQNKIFLKHMI